MPLDKPTIISRETLVPIGFVIVILAAAMWISSSNQRVEIQLLKMNSRIESLDYQLQSHVGDFKSAVDDRWRGVDDDHRMKAFASKLAILNPSLNVPDPLE